MKYTLLFASAIACFTLTSPMMADLTALLDEAFPGLSHDAFVVAELRGGLSGTALYKIDTFEKSYVLRSLKSEVLTDQDALDFFVLIEASKKGISPQVIFESPDHRSIIMEFVKEKTLTMLQAKKPENIALLAQGFQKAHQISGHPTDGEGLLSKAERSFKKVFQDKIGAEEEMLDALELVKKYSQELAKYTYLKVHVHGDLNPRNIFLTSGKVLLIDWAETTLEDPFYDLSYFALKMDYSEEDERLLLKSYLGKSPTLEQWSRYSIHKKIHLAFWSLTNLYLADVELKKHPEQKIDAEVLLSSWGSYQNKFENCLEDLPLNISTSFLV